MKRKSASASKASPKKTRVTPSSKTDSTTLLRRRVSSLTLPLPSSLNETARSNPTLRPAVSLERRERESRADFRLDQIRAHLITSFKQKQAKSKVSGQKLSTRTQSAIKRKERDIKRCAEFYREARRRLLALGMDKTDQRYRPLVQADLRAYNTSSLEDLLTSIQASKRAQKKDHQAALRSMHGQPHVSWIWENWSFVESGDLSEKVRTYFLEGMA